MSYYFSKTLRMPFEASMQAIPNKARLEKAAVVGAKLQSVVDAL